MAPDEYRALADSILNIGVQNPITILDGMVIDGWHRYTAAAESGMPCPSVELGDVNPRDFVMAQNKARRHITQAQLAMAATSVYAWRPVGQNQHAEKRVATECPPSKSNAELAGIAGVGVATIKQAKAVQSSAAPEVQEAVRRGVVGLPKASAIAKLPVAEQAAALNKPAPKPTSKPAPQPDPAAPDEYTPPDAAHEQISDLQADLVIARMGSVSDDEKQQAAALIAELRAEIKTLSTTLKATQLSRDSLLEENAQMKSQMRMQRNEIAKLKTPK